MTVRVYRDAWGVPHLRADGADELAYAQGRNAAADRAWQIEVERHRAQGTTASFLGAEAVSWDRFARRVRLEDTARRCMDTLERDDPGIAAWIRSYVDGVNDGLAEGAARAPEFAATGLAPGRWRPWAPLGVWLSTHILFAGFPAKLWRDAVARRLGPEWVGVFATDGPGTSGSNGWLVPPERTATGAAIVAGDPHRFIEAPGVYQQIRLACPEFDVVGLAVPGVPGIAHFGHAGPVAWAITNAMADYQDLYRERLRRTGPGGERVEALGPNGWRPAERHVETIEVAGGEPVTVEVIETERGPVIADGDEAAHWADPGSCVPGLPARDSAAPDTPGAMAPDVFGALALRHPPRVSADLGFGVLPALLRARSVADVDRALDGWVEPVNVVLAADTTGGTLHRVAGAVPVRHPDNRIRVVPAWEPRHAWRAWHGPMPRERVEGVAVMANQRGIAEPLGVEFAPPHRAERIRELLAERAVWSARDMAAVHRDTLLASAAPLLDLLARTDPGELGPNARRLRERLLDWDRRMDADSAGAASFAAVRTATVRLLAKHPLLRPLADPPPAPEVFRPWLALVPRVGYALEHLLATDLLPLADRAGAVRAAVEEVAAGEAAVQGPPARWGDTHRLAPWQALPADPGEPWPALAGDHDCVLATSSVPGVTDLSARASAARYVWDLARREDSAWVVPLGASGVPGDPHHRDQLPLWARCELVPVVTDWGKLTEEPAAPPSAPRTPHDRGEK
ncbi:penicillin acylase family protein [Streptomyces chitinivorans]|uniref:Penicillin acylase family protein n=1 Tax=Streptomyces chitinivorans TaxID=1257027 RepID=A0ABW7HR03_9ACTN|nr:penicillin acylase family protein [Streptomyces chitinivorans]MDH2408524.1 penicillin acylase family protein [Streptomyces chitinivorans]